MINEEIDKAIKIAGKKPINPIGSCFESSLLCLLDPSLNNEIIKLNNVRLCHGIGTATMPGQEGRKIAHGWIEYTDEDMNIDVAIDTTWGVQIPASLYREKIQLHHIIEYTPDEALRKWMLDVPPWDKKLKKIINKQQRRRK